MADISIDEGKAKIWLLEVKHELDAVEALLKKVNSVNSDPAGSDDTIMNNIYTFSTTVETAWNSMCSGFKSAQDKIEEAITAIIKQATSVIDDVDTLKSKIR